MVDLHAHSRFSQDAKGEPEQFIERAIELNCDIFGFSEHLDYDYNFSKEVTLEMLDVPKYFAAMQMLKQRYKDKIKLLCAVECGFLPQASPLYREAQRLFNFDYTINSVHMIGGLDPFFKTYFKGKDKAEAYSLYLDTVKESVLCEQYSFQIIGHIGYVTRYAPYTDNKLYYKQHKQLIDSLLGAIISRGKALEINTGIQSPHQHMPPTDIITRYRELGGKLVTFGSDCHSAQRVLDKYAEIGALLKSLGFKQYCYFENSEMFFIDI